jgi:large subunit ribosomal protein L30
MADGVKKIKITLLKSPISQKPAIRKTVTALGLHHIRGTVIHQAKPEIIGMVKAIAHMVKVEDCES